MVPRVQTAARAANMSLVQRVPAREAFAAFRSRWRAPSGEVGHGESAVQADGRGGSGDTSVGRCDPRRKLLTGGRSSCHPERPLRSQEHVNEHSVDAMRKAMMLHTNEHGDAGMARAVTNTLCP